MTKTNFFWWNSSSHWHMTFDYTWTVGKPGIGMRPPPVSVDVVVVAILRKWKWEKQNDKHAQYQNNILFIIDSININININEWKRDRKCQTSVTAPIQKRFPHGTPALKSSIDQKFVTFSRVFFLTVPTLKMTKCQITFHQKSSKLALTHF